MGPIVCVSSVVCHLFYGHIVAMLARLLAI